MSRVRLAMRAIAPALRPRTLSSPMPPRDSTVGTGPTRSKSRGTTSMSTPTESHARRAPRTRSSEPVVKATTTRSTWFAPTTSRRSSTRPSSGGSMPSIHAPSSFDAADDLEPALGVPVHEVDDQPRDLARAEQEHPLRRAPACLVRELAAGQPGERRGEGDHDELADVEPPTRDRPDRPEGPGGQEGGYDQPREAAEPEGVLAVPVAAGQPDDDRRDGREHQCRRAARADARRLPALVEEGDARQRRGRREEQDGRESVPRHQGGGRREPRPGSRADSSGERPGAALLEGKRAQLNLSGFRHGWTGHKRFHTIGLGSTPPVGTDWSGSKGEPEGALGAGAPGPGTTPQQGGPGLDLRPWWPAGARGILRG